MDINESTIKAVLAEKLSNVYERIKDTEIKVAANEERNLASRQHFDILLKDIKNEMQALNTNLQKELDEMKKERKAEKEKMLNWIKIILVPIIGMIIERIVTLVIL